MEISQVRARNGAGYGDNSSSELVILQSTATEPTRPPTGTNTQAVHIQIFSCVFPL